MTNELAARAQEIARAWQWTATSQEVAVSVLTGGLINATFRISVDGKPTAVLQRLHPIFAAAVNFDIDAVTTHLANRGMVTPRLLRTNDDEAWVVDDDGATWRALTWIDGATVHHVTSPEVARAAGELVGRVPTAARTASTRHGQRRRARWPTKFSMPPRFARRSASNLIVTATAI